MRTSYRIAPVVAALWMLMPGTAHAAVEPAAPASWGAALQDRELALHRGGYRALSFGLTARNIVEMSDAQNSDMSRVTGSIARVSMDFWWSSTGTDLIVANLRATGR